MIGKEEVEMPKKIDSRRINLIDKNFGDLYVNKLSNKRGAGNTLLWECRCTCGNTIYVQGYSLLHKHYRSCGCKQTKKRNAGVKKHIQNDTIDGTRKSSLKSNLYKNNKSGHKGVRWNKHRNKWTATIGFKRKQIFLGNFDDKEGAIIARKLAEEKYHKPYLND